jgi:hypothetical protein
LALGTFNNVNQLTALSTSLLLPGGTNTVTLIAKDSVTTSAPFAQSGKTTTSDIALEEVKNG